MPAIGSLGLALLADLLLLEPALLDLLLPNPLLGRETGGVAVLDPAFDSGLPLGGALLGADGSLDTDGAFDPLAFDPLRSGPLDALPFDSLGSGALAFDALAFNSLRSGALAFDPLARLRTLGTDSLADLRAFGANSLLLAALGGFRPGLGALRSLLGALGLLDALLVAAVGTLGVGRSGDCNRGHGGDEKCLAHKKFQFVLLCQDFTKRRVITA